MDGDTSNRRPIVTNNLVDGRVFEISPDGEWLLFTQLSEDPEIINELYIINLEEENAEPIYIKADNIIHYAEWAPGFNLGVLFSTVEPRAVAPGWQANNDLQLTTLGADPISHIARMVSTLLLPDLMRLVWLTSKKINLNH
jgi:hypothetical protein